MNLLFLIVYSPHELDLEFVQYYNQFDQEWYLDRVPPQQGPTERIRISNYTNISI